MENILFNLIGNIEIPFTEMDYIRYLMSKIERGEKPSDASARLAPKTGYILRENFYPEENRTVWEYVPIPGFSHPSGDYLNPIEYFVGMTVEKDLFYTDGDNIWMAIKTGIAPSFDSNEYFEIVGV